MATITITQEMKNRLDAEAEARGVKAGWLARKLLAEALEDLIPAEAIRLTRPRSST